MKVENAVILAAGFSSRFVPICFDIPKGLIKLKGESLIERQIRQLKELDINDIFVVTGALAESFNFLKTKFNVKLIFNNQFANKNNFASFYAAREILGNSLITSADLYFPKNIFVNEFKKPYFASVFVEGQTNQRCLTLDSNDLIVATSYGGENSWITFGGHAVISQTISKNLINYIEDVIDNPSYANKYWVDFQDEHIKELPMYIKRLQQNDIVEFNTLASLKNFDKDFSIVSQSKTMSKLCKEFNCQEKDLTNFIPIKNENEAIGFSFNYHNTEYKYFKDEYMEN